MIITLDGPAGSGKSSTARLLAKKLGAAHLDTGATYRAVTLSALERNFNLNDDRALGKLAGELTITFKESDSGQRTLINGKDRSEDIRAKRVDDAVSQVSAFPGVRIRMVELQRKIARQHPNVVAEGRDTGSVVFPEADFKFYLTAGEKARALRRCAQIGAGPENAEKVAGEITHRDARDSSRAISPLKTPEGAEFIDNTGLSLDETVQKIIELVS